MKKLLSNLLVVSLFFSFIVQASYAETAKEDVIIVFKGGVTQKEKAVKNVNGEIKEVYKNIPVMTGKLPKSAIALLKKNKDILAVEIDQRIQVNGQVEDWGIQAVNAPTAWQSQFTGKGIKVAVLDTGISPHEDLVIAGGVSFVSYTTSYTDDNGHGQHVAGIIGAKNNGIGTVGAAPDAEIYAVKVLDRNGSGYLSDIIKGIDWSITNKMDIINLSLGASTHSLSLQKAVDKAYDSGILVVAAAGNKGNADGSGDTVEYPARYESTIAVSAIDSSNRRGNFSATGTTIEVTAPGVNIFSTHLNNQYAYMNGTSMAAPYVSGTLALLKQANPTLSHVQLREKLKDTVIDLGDVGKDTFFGYGLVQFPVLTQDTNGVAKTEEIQMQSDSHDEQPTIDPTPIQEPEQEPEPIVQPTPTPVQAPESIDQPATAPVQQPVQQPVKTEPIKTVTKPAKKKKLTSTIKTAKSTYSAGNSVIVNMKVVDQVTKKPIKNAKVKLTIAPPKGKVKVVTLKTNNKGEVSYKMTTNKRTTVKGNYKLSTSTNVANYSVKTASKTIKIK
ncbi:S8 family serine peptidase [Sutcliffiella cohnii]